MKRLNRVYISFLIVMGFSFLLSCRQKNGVINEDATKLFHKTMQVLKEYTDSLNNLNDSSSIDMINQKCNELISHIQYEYKPNTYLLISESQNDSIIKSSEKYLSTLNEANIRARRNLEYIDSIEK